MDYIKVDDELQKELWRVPVDIELIRDNRINNTSFRLYLNLLSYARSIASCFPSRKTLADDLGCSVRTIDEAKKKLKKLKLIEWVKIIGKDGREHNVYTLLKYKPISRGQYSSSHKGKKLPGNNTKRNYSREEVVSSLTEEVVDKWNESAIQLNEELEGYKFQRFSKTCIKELSLLSKETLSAFMESFPYLGDYADHYSWYFDGRELPASISPSLFLKCPDRMEELISMPAQG